MAVKFNRLNSNDADFNNQLDALLAWETVSDSKVEEAVAEILSSVSKQGDAALLELTNRFDQFGADEFSELVIEKPELQKALDELPEQAQRALSLAANRIKEFHQHQQQEDWTYKDDLGNTLGQKITPLDRVGVYAPIGLASSVLMCAIPAEVAGVSEIVLFSPAPKGQANQFVLAAAALAGVDKVFCIGGAQAVAAMAFGTESVPRVDKIVGPGNPYVTTAKKEVFGRVGIDMIAGPSEILVICDGGTDPEWIAMDLFSQAEHAYDSQSILVCPDPVYIEKVQAAADKLVEDLPRKDMVLKSCEDRSILIQCKDLDEAVAISNRVAPEHLELSVENPNQYLAAIKHAGAIFMGRHTPEALGDYMAGPNHVLPTSGTARFFSPLGVYDFQKKSSIIYASPEGASELGLPTQVLAEGEELRAHGLSAAFRVKK